MRPFKHIQASSLEEAAALAAHEGVMVIAGGTDLLGTLKDECLPWYPNYIVDLKNIPGLDAITETDSELVIGALVKLQDIADSEPVRTHAQALAEACGRAASPAIRSMGTLGGNICQMHRCWYFRCPDNRFVCSRKGGNICYAYQGDNYREKKSQILHNDLFSKNEMQKYKIFRNPALFMIILSGCEKARVRTYLPVPVFPVAGREDACGRN